MSRSIPIVLAAESRLVRLGRPGLVAAALVLAVFLPYAVPSFQLSQITSGFILAIAVVGLNLLSGFGGQISLGHAAFFGLGAYGTGILVTTYDVSPWLAVPIMVPVCLLAGALIALPALRVRGMYLALVTLSVGIIFPSLVRRFEALTGGSSGLFGIEFPAPDTAYFVGRAGQTVWLYWVVLSALVISIFVVWAVMHSRMGRAVVALRDNETAAVVMGVNRTWIRTALFSISAAIAGLGGAMFALKSGVITPESFSLILTLDLLVAMVLGGSGSYVGPVLGGLALYYVPAWTSDLGAGSMSGVLFGAVVLALVFVLPTGIAGGARALGRRVVHVEPSLHELRSSSAQRSDGDSGTEAPDPPRSDRSSMTTP